MNSPDGPPDDGAAAVAQVCELLRGFATESGASGVTLWKEEGGELVALANPLEPGIVGLRQSLGRGIISKVYHTGQPILENAMVGNAEHDRSIDQALGTQALAMMAAPVNGFRDESDGVVSAVLLASHEARGDFSLESLQRLAALAPRLAELWPTR